MVGVATGPRRGRLRPVRLLDRDLRDAAAVRVHPQRAGAAPAAGANRRRRRRPRVRHERDDPLRARGHRGDARATRADRARAGRPPPGSRRRCSRAAPCPDPSTSGSARTRPRRSRASTVASARPRRADRRRTRRRDRRHRLLAHEAVAAVELLEAQRLAMRGLVVAACLSPAPTDALAERAARRPRSRSPSRRTTCRGARLARLGGRRRAGPRLPRRRCGVADLPGVRRERGVHERRARPLRGGDRPRPRSRRWSRRDKAADTVAAR